MAQIWLKFMMTHPFTTLGVIQLTTQSEQMNTGENMSSNQITVLGLSVGVNYTVTIQLKQQ